MTNAPTPIADSASDFCRHGRVIGACPFCAAGEPPAPAVGAEDVARVIDPRAFENWQSLFDYSVNADGNEDAARRCADHFHKAVVDDAMSKARDILALFSGANSKSDGGVESRHAFDREAGTRDRCNHDPARAGVAPGPSDIQVDVSTALSNGDCR